jgi:hypothetical protein
LHIYIIMITEANLIQKTKEVMIKLNAELFDNQLKLNFPVKISKSGKAMASVMCRGVGFSFSRVWFVSYLQISKYFNWTEAELESTIAHELIHVYEVQVLKRKPSHDHYFKAKMNDLNRKHPHLNITIRHTNKSTKPVKLNQSKMIDFLMSEDKQKVVFLSKSLISRLHSLKGIESHFGKYTLGKISSDKVQGYSVSRRLRYSYKMTPALNEKLSLYASF